MKKITIPIQFGYPAVKVCINDIEYICLTGKEIEVEDCVAELFESMQHKIPKPAPIVPPFIPGGGSGGGSAVIEPLNITENGTYEAPSGVHGYNPVVVNVAGGGGGEKILYMDAALLNAGGAYPVDADDYTTAVIPAGVTFLDAEAFENLPNIDTVIILCDCEFEVIEEYYSGSKSNVPYNAFTIKPLPLKKVVLNDAWTSIPENFLRCRKDFARPLEEIQIGKNVTTIGAFAFNGCIALTSIDIPDGVTIIGESAFAGCRSLTSIDIPDGVKDYPHGMLNGCSSITSFTIPDGVTSIGEFAFDNTGLTEITIPASVESVGSCAFQLCSNLKTITFLGMDTEIEVDKSATIIGTATIRGYAGSTAETYATTYGNPFEVIE